MNTLKLNGAQIHSLPELRRHPDFPAVAAAFLDGTLGAWLSACYYEREAAEAKDLDHVLSPAVERRLREILGMEPPAMPPEELAAWNRKRDALLRCGADEALLAHIPETATNQAELAELLDSGCETVFLCEGSFSVPIRKSGVHYIGVGAPEMEARFTEEQYRRAGITFENVALPQQPDRAVSRMAEEAARANGYDGFAETHCRLAALLHQRVKGSRAVELRRLDLDLDPAGAFYPSRWAAESAARRSIDSAYEAADACFIPGRIDCLASPLAETYGEWMQRGAELAGRLQSLPGEKGDLARELARKICGAREELRRRFERELTDRAGCYRMYKKSYFLERVEIERNSYAGELFDNEILGALAGCLFPGGSDYSVENLCETLAELEEDLDRHAGAFFYSAWEIYRMYRREVEDLAEEIGKDLSDEDLQKLGVQVG